jgi:enoyl-CoA hydratase/carnithine racemase
VVARPLRNQKGGLELIWGSGLSKGIGKQAFYAQIDLDQPKAYAYAMEVMAATALTEDAQEGMRTFLEKRKPTFKDK